MAAFENVAVQVFTAIIAFGLTDLIVFRGRRHLRLATRVAFFATLSAILFVNDSAPFAPASAGPDVVTAVALSVAKAAWWLVGSSCLVGVVRIFLIFERKPHEARLLQDLVVAVVYVGAFLSIISYVFSVPVGTVVATSGVFAIILGLALQSTLSDVFSGIALNIGQPYLVGDWIVIEDGSEGKVVETNWRATYLLSGTNDLVAVPNSVLAKSKIINRSSPDPVHGTSVKIKFTIGTTPAAIVELMENALTSANRILKTPAPSARICSMDAQGVELELSFRIEGLSYVAAAKNEVFDLAFRHAKAAGIRLADEGGVLASQSAEQEPAHPGTTWRLVNAIPLFAGLTEDEKEMLSSVMTRRTFRKGAVIAKYGETLNALMIVRSGIVSIEHESKELLRLSPGDWFGEGGLLLGAPETGTSTALSTVVAYEIAQKDVAVLVNDRPTIADEIGSVLARRLEEERRRLSHDEVRRPVSSLASRIRHFFSVSNGPAS